MSELAAEIVHVVKINRGDFDFVSLAVDDERLNFEGFNQAIDGLVKAVEAKQNAEWKLNLGELMEDQLNLDAYAVDPPSTRWCVNDDVNTARNAVKVELAKLMNVAAVMTAPTVIQHETISQ